MERYIIWRHHMNDLIVKGLGELLSDIDILLENRSSKWITVGENSRYSESG